MRYTIKQIADLAGVSTRTLRYYDEIGLLCPAETGENGYRLYNHTSLLQLQQILFFRELDMPLKEIRRYLGGAARDLAGALEKHRKALEQRSKRLDRLIETIDETIATIKGEWVMTDKAYFEGFDERQYEEETRQRWGQTPAYAESQRKWASYTSEQREAIKAEGGRLTVRMVSQNPNAAVDDADVQAAVGEYYAYLNKYFYTCEVGFLRNLAEMWVEDERFAVNYERIRQGGAAFVRDAVRLFCERFETSQL